MRYLPVIILAVVFYVSGAKYPGLLAKVGM